MKLIELIEIKVDPELQGIFGEKDESLISKIEETIIKTGTVLDTFYINNRRDFSQVLLEGHTRLIAARNQKEYIDPNARVSVEYLDLDTLDEEKLWIRTYQKSRRNLDKAQSRENDLAIGSLYNQIKLPVGTNQFTTISTNENERVGKLAEANEVSLRRSDELTGYYETKNNKKIDSPNQRIAKENGISERSVRNYAAVSSNLKHLGKLYCRTSYFEPENLEIFDPLYLEGRLSQELLKDIVSYSNDGLFDQPIKNLLFKCLEDKSVNIKQQWEKIKVRISNKYTTNSSHEKVSIKKEESVPSNTTKEASELEISLIEVEKAKELLAKVLELSNNNELLSDIVPTVKNLLKYVKDLI